MTFLIKFIMYAISLIGLWYIVRPFMEKALRTMASQMDYRLKLQTRSWGNRTSRLKKKNWIYQHLDDLLYMVDKNYQPGISIVRFTLKNTFLFLGVFIISYITFSELPNHFSFNNPFTDGVQMERIGAGLSWHFPLIFTLMISSIPYLRLRYKYSLNHVQASYDLLEIVQIFSKFSYLSIDAALQNTAKMLGKNNVLKQPLYILSETFSSYSNEQELREELQRFNRTVDTTFSIQFTSDILYAEKEGSHFIRESMTKLKEEMENHRASILDVQSNSRDAIQMGIWGNLLVLLLCTVSMMLLTKPDIYMRLQFQTKTGLIFISIITVSIFISFIFSYVLSRPRLDYK